MQEGIRIEIHIPDERTDQEKYAEERCLKCNNAIGLDKEKDSHYILISCKPMMWGKKPEDPIEWSRPPLACGNYRNKNI